MCSHQSPRTHTKNNAQSASTASETCVLFGNSLRTPPAGWATFRSIVDLSRCFPDFDQYAIGTSVTREEDIGKIGETYVYAGDFAVPLTDSDITQLGFTADQVRDSPKSLNIARPPTASGVVIDRGQYLADPAAAGMHIDSNAYGLLDSKRPGETDSAGDMRMGFVQQAKRLSQRVLTGPSTSTQVRLVCVCSCVRVCVLLLWHVCVCCVVFLYVCVDGDRKRRARRQRNITGTATILLTD